MDFIERTENYHNGRATDYCNAPQSEAWLERWNARKDRDLAKLGEMLPKAAGHLFINQDPRGYALKIDSDSEAGRAVIDAAGVARDWGGYGLLCREAYK